jgi:hypothetical protein
LAIAPKPASQTCCVGGVKLGAGGVAEPVWRWFFLDEAIDRFLK